MSVDCSCLSGMVSKVAASNAAVLGFKSQLSHTSDLINILVATVLDTLHYGVRAMTGWYGFNEL